jgi:hypothetical protein
VTVGVVYVATHPSEVDEQGRPVVLYVGRTTWGSWWGWEQCFGQCERERRAKHRMCSHLEGRGRSARWSYEIDWAAGGVWSRRPVPGRLSYRFALGQVRTAELEAETIRRLSPRVNVALNRGGR